MRASGLLFDLDNTLIPELPNYSAAFMAACGGIARDRGADVRILRDAVFAAATDRWLESPVAEYCARLGIGSPTSLLSDFPGDAAELGILREWATGYRNAAWQDGLAAAGLADGDALAPQLSQAFRQAFRSHCPAYIDVPRTLDLVAPGRALAVVTNGIIDVQRIKLAVSGLRRHFRVLIASSEVGAGKPDPRLFEAALASLGLPPDEVIVIGDSPEKDLAGAKAAGLRRIWLDRAGATGGAVEAEATIRSLTELPALLS